MQDCVTFVEGILVLGEFYARANAGDFHAPGQQRERGTQIFALFRRYAGHGVVCGNVEPGGFSIYEE
jgi:hypothetical protein